MRGKPFIIVMTMILSAIGLFSIIPGTMRLLAMLPLIDRGEMSRMEFISIAERCVGFFLLCSITFYAALKRVRWGYPVILCFALVMLLVSVVGALHPDPQVPFQVDEGADKIGTHFGQSVMLAAEITYTIFVAFGRRTRAYFARNPSATSE